MAVKTADNCFWSIACPVNGGSAANPASSFFNASRKAARVCCSSCTIHLIAPVPSEAAASESGRYTRKKPQGSVDSAQRYREIKTHSFALLYRSLPDFIKLAGRLQQIELRLLALEICVEVGHPLVVLFEAGSFHFTHVYSPFSELRLEHGEILLR